MFDVLSHVQAVRVAAAAVLPLSVLLCVLVSSVWQVQTSEMRALLHHAQLPCCVHCARSTTTFLQVQAERVAVAAVLLLTAPPHDCVYRVHNLAGTGRACCCSCCSIRAGSLHELCVLCALYLMQCVYCAHALQVQAERVAVDAVLSELELLVTKLVGVGIYDLQPKQWQQRLRGKTTVDELCE